MSISKEKDLKKLMNSVEGVTLKEAHGKKFHFPFYFTESMNQVSIEALELGVRASNALHRSGFHTIGELTEAMDSGFELKSVRSCGAQTVRA
jgi:DNA-directed RNA polymerase alpha subunit